MREYHFRSWLKDRYNGAWSGRASWDLGGCFCRCGSKPAMCAKCDKGCTKVGNSRFCLGNSRFCLRNSRIFLRNSRIPLNFLYGFLRDCFVVRFPSSSQ